MLAVSLRVARTSRAAERSGRAALAILFVLERRLHLYHMHALDSSALPLLLEPPFVVVYTPGPRNPPPTRVALDCFAARLHLRACACPYEPLAVDGI